MEIGRVLKLLILQEKNKVAMSNVTIKINSSLGKMGLWVFEIYRGILIDGDVSYGRTVYRIA